MTGHLMRPPDQDPAQQTPPQQTPAEQPSAQQTPAEQPPAQQPPAEQPPAQQPPAQQPLARLSPAQLSPAGPPASREAQAREIATRIWARTRASISTRSWSIRRRVGYAFALAGILLVAGFVLGGLALHAVIVAAEHGAQSNLHSATTDIVAVAIAGGVAIIAGAVLAWTGLNAWIARPLASLGRQAQAVASGTLDSELAVKGPREVVELAADVEAMRRQLLHSMNDLTFKAGELQRSNRELEQFAYVASHDLQEPLRKVASFCQMLESRYSGQLDERAHQYIAYAVDGAKRMQVLINELLLFSRVGQSGTVIGPVDLNEVARLAVEGLDATIADTDAQIDVGHLPVVSGDRTLLTQLFQNLIGNSIKFRRMAQRPVVQITAERKGDYWEFACADNGIGIEHAYAERVFVIFQRLHPREAYQGTGIGLAMCRKIVDFHGGQIWVDGRASAGPGTTIRWTLPAYPKGVQETG